MLNTLYSIRYCYIRTIQSIPICLYMDFFFNSAKCCWVQILLHISSPPGKKTTAHKVFRQIFSPHVKDIYSLQLYLAWVTVHIVHKNSFVVISLVASQCGDRSNIKRWTSLCAIIFHSYTSSSKSFRHSTPVLVFVCARARALCNLFGWALSCCRQHI